MGHKRECEHSYRVQDSGLPLLESFKGKLRFLLHLDLVTRHEHGESGDAFRLEESVWKAAELKEPGKRRDAGELLFATEQTPVVSVQGKWSGVVGEPFRLICRRLCIELRTIKQNEPEVTQQIRRKRRQL